MHFTDTYLPRRDGVVTSVRTLVAALASQGHAALTVVPRHPDLAGYDGLLQLTAVPCGVADLRMSPWLLRSRWARDALDRLTAAAPDVIHVHTPGPVGLLGVLGARRLGVPLVQTYHTDLHAYADAYRLPNPALQASVRLYAHRLGMARPKPATGGGRRRAALDATNVLLLGSADALVVPTRAVLGRLDVPVAPERINIIPTGVAARPVTVAAVAAFRAAHAIAATDRVILFVGRVNQEKGVALLVDAFARISLADPRLRLVLVGAVYDQRWLSESLHRAGVGDRVVSTGQQPPDIVAAAYGCAEVFAFSSTTDTQALVLQEAAHAGVPVIMVDAALHKHGPLAGAAVLTGPSAKDLAGGIRALLDDPVRARRLAATAARHAAGHTPDAYATAMLAVYTRVLAERTATAVSGSVSSGHENGPPENL